MKLLNEIDTIEKLKEGYSISRFGDGEFFRIMKEEKDISKLQTYNKRLKKMLYSIFSNPCEKLLIGIPSKLYGKSWVYKFHEQFIPFFENSEAYNISKLSSAFISRPSLVNLDNQEYFDLIKSIWKNKTIVLMNFNIELQNHYLFKDSDIYFIEISRQNCFENYNALFNECKKYFNKNIIFIASAGPTSSVLAYNIASQNEQCIDIGQLAFEYSLFKNEENLESWTSQNSYRRK